MRPQIHTSQEPKLPLEKLPLKDQNALKDRFYYFKFKHSIHKDFIQGAWAIQPEMLLKTLREDYETTAKKFWRYYRRRLKTNDRVRATDTRRNPFILAHKNPDASSSEEEEEDSSDE